MEFDDGLLRVNVKDREPFDLDIYTAKLAIEEFELKHAAQRYQDEHGQWMWKVTAAMSVDLQAAFKAAGAPFISGALAMDLWLKVNEAYEDCKKKWHFLPTSPESTESAPTDLPEANLSA